ncbi:MAG TPA: cobyric acid synthase [Methanocella sp.]|uniref:cobyric acid synthase n=1 Tax=Methanocella sp. TaxID=2052833 RepID=UPI002BC53F2E|nr:cobyric acid synthase [Methanocella sp.]HTY90553.1 cobyric acid synthase [Methanocella sp.]
MSPNGRAKVLAVLGTQSHAGKSVIVTALCRILKNRGYRVAPFKSQNMSLNSWITKDNKEIGIAQAVQAFAAGAEPSADMNPVLLKPKGGMTSQVIVLGVPLGDRSVGQYYTTTEEMMAIATGALGRLSSSYDVIVMEGAGGAAEINLYDRDIANTRMAKAAGAPVILVGDIERGGVFASLYGTIALLPEEDRKLVKGIIINKFRGDPSLLRSGIEALEKMTGVPVLGIIPYERLSIPSEDSVSIEDKRETGRLPIDIAVIRFPLISNFTDFEPLERVAGVRYVPLGGDLGNPDIVILPGTKNTVSDLRDLSGSPMFAKIKALAAGGTPVIGICGGYQMLGERVVDSGIEGDNAGTLRGLGLLPVETRFDAYEKTARQVTKRVTGDGPILGPLQGSTVSGYEIHMGQTASCSHVFEDDGCADPSGLVIGTYLHGLFENRGLTDSLLSYACRRKGLDYSPGDEPRDAYDELAGIVEPCLDMKALMSIIEAGCD